MLTRRRMIVFSLRSLLIATLASAVGFWKLRQQLSQSRSQERVIRKLERLGGSVGYAHEWDYVADRYSGAPKPGIPLVRSMLGDHYYLRPDLLMFDEVPITATDLSEITQLKTLRYVAILDAPGVDDDVIDLLLALPDLEEISLRGTSVTFAGASRLRSLSKLRTLWLSHTLVDERQAEVLRRMFPAGVIEWDNEPYRRTSEFLNDVLGT